MIEQPKYQITRPMLAGKIKPTDVGKLRYPLIATPKLDGIRCLIINGQAVSRKFLPIPNVHTRVMLERAKLPHNLDGELMLSQKAASFQNVSSAFMSHEGEPDFVYCVFDLVTMEGGLVEPYEDRIWTLERWAKNHAPSFVKPLKATVIKDADELELYEEGVVKAGYEGVCLRSPDSPYKLGRSTVSQQWLLALKRFMDAEAEIIGFVEAEKNTNKATKDNVGSTKRSSAKVGKVAKDTLGAFVVRGFKGRWKGVEFNIGTGIGLSAELKKEIWSNQKKFMGKIIKYKYQSTGSKDAPRIPSFQGFRDWRDL